MDVNKDGHISREDYELMAKRTNEYSKATGEQAESCNKAFKHVADVLGFAPGVKVPREEAIKSANEMLLKEPWEKKKEICFNAFNMIFDAIDLNHDGHISLEEFKIWYQMLGVHISDEDKVKSFNLINVNKDGEISRQEFLDASFEYLHGFEDNELSKILYGPLLD